LASYNTGSLWHGFEGKGIPCRLYTKGNSRRTTIPGSQSDLNWVDQVNYTAQKAQKALHFVMHVIKKGNRNIKTLAYTSLVCPILEYESVCWGPCTEGKINALD
jgi:hypothetical protein